MELLCLWCPIWMFAGAVIGQSRAQPIAGALWGFFLGPIGIMIVLLTGGRVCPSCRSTIHPHATVCPRCQSRTRRHSPRRRHSKRRDEWDDDYGGEVEDWPEDKPEDKPSRPPRAPRRRRRR